jgi:putative sterol carrier protein
VRYLSLEWIDALNDAVANSATMQEAAATQSIGVTQAVTGTPDGDVSYHLQVSDGRATFGAGPADPEDVRMEQDWDTAVGIALGNLDLEQALFNGRLRFSGDPERLMSARDVFAALNTIFDSVRARTVYE